MSHLESMVLIVDDTPGVRDVIARFLQTAGVESEPAACMESAFDRLERGGISVVLVDIDLGDEDATGVDLIRRIRGLTNPPAVVIITGYSHLAADLVDVPLIKKPINTPEKWRELVEVVKEKIRDRCRDAQLEDTLKIAQGTHSIVCGLRDTLAHPETGLKAAHDIAKAANAVAVAARSRGLAALVKETLKNPLVWGLVVLAGGLLKHEIETYERMGEEHRKMRDAFIRMEAKVK